jgi:hypothetical protein
MQSKQYVPPQDSNFRLPLRLPQALATSLAIVFVPNKSPVDMFFSSKSPPPTPASTSADTAPTVESMDSEQVKNSLIKQMQQESASNNLRLLVEVCPLASFGAFELSKLIRNLENQQSLFRQVYPQSRRLTIQHGTSVSQ